jgi:hypothetical protein
LAWWGLFRAYHTYSFARIRRKAAAPAYANLATDVASFAQQADLATLAEKAAPKPQ